jgi:hypothetical protein
MTEMTNHDTTPDLDAMATEILRSTSGLKRELGGTSAAFIAARARYVEARRAMRRGKAA